MPPPPPSGPAPPGVVSVEVAGLATASAWKQDADLRPQVEKLEQQKQTWKTTFLLAFNSLGVIYGDLGTSPLYVFSSTFTSEPTKDEIYGVMSLIFWLLTLICVIKYVLIVLHADHDGEGGTFALYSLLCRRIGIVPGRPISSDNSGNKDLMSEGSLERHSHQRWKRAPKLVERLLHAPSVSKAFRAFFRTSRAAQLALLFLAISAAGLLLGDAIITPSISVMSAVGGLTNIPVPAAAASITQPLIVGVSSAILVLLFSFEFNGTRTVGLTFSPVMSVWFLCLLGMGIYNIHVWGGGDIFASLSPKWAFDFLVNGKKSAWLMLGGVVLAVTGTETMYADLGHFSRRAVNIAFIGFVYPCVVITYLGQAAFLAGNQGATSYYEYPDGTTGSVDASNAALYYSNLFWNSVPRSQGFFYFMLVVGNLAAVIASQAVISGSFSIVRQAISLGVFPRMRVSHTSKDMEGQIYIGPINWFLCLLCIAITAGFGINSPVLGEPITLANAYGVAVTGTMFLTTLLISLAMIIAWEMNPVVPLFFLLFYGALDGCLFSSTLTKVPEGGWFPLLVAGFLVSIQLSWWSGSRKKSQILEANAVQLSELLELALPPRGDDHGAAPSGRALDSVPSGRRDSLSGERNLQASSKGVEQPQAPRELHPSLRRTTLLRHTRATVARTPGLGVYYTDSESEGSTPPIMVSLIKRMHVVHEVALIVTVRTLPLPHVPVRERLLIRIVQQMPNFYQVIARYGYADRIDHGPAFISLVVASIHRKIQKGYLKRGDSFDAPRDPLPVVEEGPQVVCEADEDVEAGREPARALNSASSLHLASIRSLDRSSGQAILDRQRADDCVQQLLAAVQHGCIYFTPRARLQVDGNGVMAAFHSLTFNPKTWGNLGAAVWGLARVAWYSTIYGFLEANAFYQSSAWAVPEDAAMRIYVPVPYKV